MPSSLEASKPLLFRLLLEIRLMIYRYSWKIDPKPYTTQGSSQPRASYVKQQLLAIGKVGAICQQIKTEAFDEYFPHARAYLRWEYDDAERNYSYESPFVKEIILSSPLLLARLRHVSFYWHGDVLNDWCDMSAIEPLYWLQSLSQLRTLEVVVTGGSEWWWFREYRATQMCSILENLRGLEKVTIKFDFSDLSREDARECKETLNGNKYFLKFKRKMESIVKLPEDATPPQKLITEHLGYLNPRLVRTKSSRI